MVFRALLKLYLVSISQSITSRPTKSFRPNSADNNPSLQQLIQNHLQSSKRTSSHTLLLDASGSHCLTPRSVAKHILHCRSRPSLWTCRFYLKVETCQILGDCQHISPDFARRNGLSSAVAIDIAATPLKLPRAEEKERTAEFLPVAKQ